MTSATRSSTSSGGRATFAQAGAGFVGLVGVQSNQFPRALDLGRQFRAAGLPVVIGGFHVSGCLSMLPDLPPDLQEALDLGITLFAGEGEGRMDELLRDIDTGTLKPIYNYLKDLPGMEAAALPVLPRWTVTRVAGHYASFDAGRGCPFQCSFCTIINVQGRKSRHRTADDVEAIVRANAAQGHHALLRHRRQFRAQQQLGADPRSPDRAARARDGSRSGCSCQVDTLCHRIPGFIEKCARAGCTARVHRAGEHQPRIADGRPRSGRTRSGNIARCCRPGSAPRCMTYAGYILGFPTDTPESIARDIEIIKRELPIDLLEFFFLTPLPGSEDHQKLHRARRADGSGYEQLRPGACLHRPCDHVEGDLGARSITTPGRATIHRRAYRNHHAPRGGQRHQPVEDLRWVTMFGGSPQIEARAPAAVRLFAAQGPHVQRRYGMPIVNPLIFYPWRLFDLVSTLGKWLQLVRRNRRIQARVEADPAKMDYMDEALTPTTGGDVDHFVEVFADKIPHTHGAPVQAVAAGG